MGIIVQKFGGTSVSKPKAIKRVARRIVEYKSSGNNVAVVVSAMGNTTDELYTLASKISKNPSPRELDMLVTCGERISTALLSMAISEIGYKSESFTGSQAGIITTEKHGNSDIIKVKANRIKDAIARDVIPVVAGFQGVSNVNKEITTLGRGGSDITALALAEYLNAEICEIFTDVDGVFETNPFVIPKAKLFDFLDYDFMYKMSEYGAEVLHPKSVKFAQKSNVPIHVRSSFTNRTGTIVGGIKNCEYTVGPMEKLKVTSVIDSPKGIAYKINGSNAVISTITSKNVEQITVPVADIDQNIKQIYKTLQTI